ncbi:hypothetical protein BURMUCGD1_2668 [Burkholderia multivorans CGD1]|nr:hypothetical protein BURMUCGD1_2668 [Burkholderia multivorans CGD1]
MTAAQASAAAAQRESFQFMTGPSGFSDENRTRDAIALGDEAAAGAAAHVCGHATGHSKYRLKVYYRL